MSRRIFFLSSSQSSISSLKKTVSCRLRGGFDKLNIMSSKTRMTTMSMSMSRRTIRGMTRTTRGITRMMETTRTIIPDANDNERQQTIIPLEEEAVAIVAEVEIEADAVVHIMAMKGQVIRKMGAVVGQVI